MKIKYYSPRWGYAHIEIDTFCQQVADAGFDGIEMNLDAYPAVENTELAALKENNLELIAQHSETLSPDFEEHRKHYRASLERIARHNTPFINAHTGRDWFAFEQNLILIDDAAEISAATGVPVIHETHRGRFCYSAAVTHQFLLARPDLRLTADFSHWCTVSESFLQDQLHLVDTAIDRSDHIHSRIGFDQGPQVNDPRAPEWAETVELYLKWWDRIIECRRKAGAETITITAEFGPPPYLPVLPFSQKPVANQWDINIYMMELLKARYTQT